MKMYHMAVIFFAVLIFLSCTQNDLKPGGSGLIEATEITVSVESGGRLLKIFFKEGDKINKNDTIALIDTLTIALRLNQARAANDAAQTKINSAGIAVEQAENNLVLARREFERVSSLMKTGSVNQQQFDRLENGYRQAGLAVRQSLVMQAAAEAELTRIRAEIALLEKQLNDCYPIAPVSGTVIDKFIDVGELIGIGRELITIARLDSVWVKIYLPPADLAEIKLGDRVEIDPEDGRDRNLNGIIRWISSEAEFTPKNVQTKEARADLVYAVKIDIANKAQRLKIGMPVSVTIP